MTPRYTLALATIREAGTLASGYFRNLSALTIKSKGLQDMVSEADLNTELLIKQRIFDAFPQDAFLGEETGVTDFTEGQGIWVVDPIDGTQPFISGLTNWCISIAYVQHGKVQFGLVYAPARDELFAGGVGIPATLNGAPMPRHPGKSLQDGITGMGYSARLKPEDFLRQFEAFLRAGGMFYRDGSGAIDLCYVAAGRLIGYYEPHINSWDCLGAIAVIEAQGLQVNDFLAGDGLTRGNPIIAGVPEVYEDLLRISRL
ncbi:MAG: inositol monophosphatase [Candidatus Saccharibacteria bacterium]|nr:inositol monophosphatase [Pseudorhodobacter sp.]